MIILKLFLFSAFILFSYAHANLDLSQDEKNYLKEKKEIKVCLSPKGLPLYGSKDHRKIGILPEVMHLIEDKMPVPLRYVPVKDWKECIALSKKGTVDIAALILASPNRHTHLVPSKKVIEASLGLATKITAPLTEDISKLDIKSIASLKGQKSIAAFVKQRFPEVKVITVNSIDEGLDLVAKGKADGYIDETYTLAYHILNLYSNELKIIDRVSEKPMAGALGVRKDEPLLLSVMNKAIDQIDPQKVRDIVHRWISVKVEKGFNYVLLVQVTAVFFLLMLVSIYWIRKLAKEVEKRKFIENELKELNENLEEEISKKVALLHYKDAILMEKTKLAAMGEMMGSIAHQWRKPLSTLHINIEMLEADYRENRVDENFLSTFIEKNSRIIQYMSRTIDDFQHFYRIDKEKKIFDVRKKIDAVLDLKMYQLEENDITVTISGESFSTLGYASEFQQVILNIIGNAKDALVEKGVAHPTIEIKIFYEGNRGIIRISDNAGGIDIDMINKVFEPYVTSKDSSNGTGLGLYMSKMIIEKNMQGKLSIGNVDDGTEVTIELRREKDE
ncbi:ATP-binding protein [Sulfurovum sp. NBC37-1]|uniref:ATP-binding protein n=1 Tax=Sulfurovum sp. (strain NBC37-1) TaxID=387093 RepID=UPI0001587A77|nr:transporter substrate-binding domain-containing protein [Sulfurovum sp. NBC37-1]BAF73315.1 hypothetical protein SUN_2379 [Sulfurovum sp. NBC37-1]